MNHRYRNDGHHLCKWGSTQPSITCDTVQEEFVTNEKEEYKDGYRGFNLIYDYDNYWDKLKTYGIKCLFGGC